MLSVALQQFLCVCVCVVCSHACVWIETWCIQIPCLMMCKDQLELCVLSAWVLIGSQLGLVMMPWTLSRHEATDDTVSIHTLKTRFTTTYPECPKHWISSISISTVFPQTCEHNWEMYRPAFPHAYLENSFRGARTTLSTTAEDSWQH